MLSRLYTLFRRIPWSLWTVLGLILLLWIVGRIIGPLLWVVSLLALIAATYWIVRPDYAALVARSDSRPWLVRLREHSWRSVSTPFARSIPRGLAYAVIAFGWWWLLS